MADDADFAALTNFVVLALIDLHTQIASDEVARTNGLTELDADTAAAVDAAVIADLADRVGRWSTEIPSERAPFFQAVEAALRRFATQTALGPGGERIRPVTDVFRQSRVEDEPSK